MLDRRTDPVTHPQLKPGVLAAGQDASEPHTSYAVKPAYRSVSASPSFFGMMLNHPFATAGLALVFAQLFMPADNKPIQMLGTAAGAFMAREQHEHTAATGDLTRTVTQATVDPQIEASTVHEAQGGDVVMSQLAGMACIASMFFGQGSNSSYQDVRDGLRSGCGIAAATRQNIISEQRRLLAPAPP